MALALQTTALTKRFAAAVAVDHVSMSLERGCIYGLVGKNGAGKSTLMKLLGGIVRPNSGEIIILGETTQSGLGIARKKTGFLIERPALYDELNAVENLTFYAKVHGIADKGKIDALLDLVSLKAEVKKTVEHYSQGMKQRLGLAVALLHDPEILVLDEPTNGLDPSGIIEIRNTLRRLAQEQNVSILLSTHLLGEVQHLADTIGFLKDGKLVQEISQQELHKVTKTSLLLATDNTAGTERLLAAMYPAVSYTFDDEGNFLLPQKAIRLDALLAALAKDGIGIQKVDVQASNLEDYYLAIMEDASDERIS